VSKSELQQMKTNDFMKISTTALTSHEAAEVKAQS